MEKPVEDKILSEAEGAHRKAQEILALLQETDEEDPIRTIIKLLLTIEARQRQLISKVDSIEVTVIALQRQRDGLPG
jgi:Trp operon repressor